MGATHLVWCSSKISIANIFSMSCFWIPDRWCQLGTVQIGLSAPLLNLNHFLSWLLQLNPNISPTYFVVPTWYLTIYPDTHHSPPIILVGFANRFFCDPYLFFLLIVTTHWRLDYINDIVGVSFLRRYGVYTGVDVIPSFVFTHSAVACVVLSNLSSSTVPGSSLRACITCRKTWVVDANIICFDRNTAFADRFAI